MLDDFPGWTTRFDLLYRLEIGGRFVAPLGRPLWSLSATSKLLSPNELDYWRGRIGRLSGSIETFDGYSLSRCYPQAHPNGDWPGAFNATVGSVVNPNSIIVTGAPVGFTWTVGDLFGISESGVYRVRVVDGSTLTFVPSLEGGETGADIIVEKPSVPMLIMPGSLQVSSGRNGWGRITFDAIESRADIVAAFSYLLLEGGDYLLLEDGGRIIL